MIFSSNSERIHQKLGLITAGITSSTVPLLNDVGSLAVSLLNSLPLDENYVAGVVIDNQCRVFRKTFLFVESQF